MSERGTIYIVYEDIPLERFENFVMPPMPAKDVVLMLAGVSPFDYSRIDLPGHIATEIRKLLIDGLTNDGSATWSREEAEKFVDDAVAEVRAGL